MTLGIMTLTIMTFNAHAKYCQVVSIMLSVNMLIVIMMIVGTPQKDLNSKAGLLSGWFKQ